MIDFTEFYNRVAEPIVARFFRTYKDCYKSAAMDLPDLNQEIYLMIWEIIEKNKKAKKPKNDDDLGKYINKAIHWRLWALKRPGKKSLGKCCSITDFQSYSSIPSGIEHNDIISLYETEPTLPETMPLMKTIRVLLDDKEFDVFIKKRFEGLNVKQIGNSLGVTRQRASQIYVQAIKKIKENWEVLEEIGAQLGHTIPCRPPKIIEINYDTVLEVLSEVISDLIEEGKFIEDEELDCENIVSQILMELVEDSEKVVEEREPKLKSILRNKLLTKGVKNGQNECKEN